MQTRKIYKQHALALIILVLFSFFSQAATITAVADGNWADGTTWDSGVVPTTNDDIIIPTGITVTQPTGSNLTTNANFASLEVTGTLTIEDDLIFDQWSDDNITIKNGGEVNIGNNIEINIGEPGMHITVENGGKLFVENQITSTSSSHEDRYIHNYGYIEIGFDITLDINIYNYVTGAMLVHGNIEGQSVLRMYNYGIITIDQDLNLFKTELENYASGNLIVFGQIYVMEGSHIINDGYIQSTNFRYASNTNNPGLDNTNGTLIVIEEIITDGSNCPGCPDKLGELYYGSINSSANCSGYASCADFLSGGNQVTLGRKLWLNAGFIGYGQGDDNEKIYQWFDLANQYGFKMNQQTEAYQPTLKNNSTNNVNFNPTVSFDGSEIYTILDDIDGEVLYFDNANGGYGVFAVIVPKSTGDQFAFDYGTYDTEGYGLMYSEDTYKMYTPISAGGVESSHSPHGQGAAPTLLTQTTTWNGNQLLYLNGAQEQSDAVTLTKIEETEVTPSTSRFTIGGQCNSPINYDFDGSIAELIIYQVDVNETTRKSIESFLALKYGIPLPHEYTDYYGQPGNFQDIINI
ncbi:MAG: hypothetical protein ACOCWB_08920, partial [Bacteroidota bacterium]